MKKLLLFLYLSFVWSLFTVNAQQRTIWSKNFDSKDLSDWTLIDADADGESWFISYNLGSNWQMVGTPFLVSMSYTQYFNPGYLFPDNWAITPGIDLSSVNQGEKIQFSWCLFDSVSVPYTPSPNNENYAVYIAESNDTTSLVAAGIKFTESNIPVVYTERSIDISDYAGKTIYIAFRHYNVSDSYEVTSLCSEVDIDNMSVTAGNSTSVLNNTLNSKISVFPNPAYDYFEIATPSTFSPKMVEILDISGKVVKSYQATTKFDVSDLPSGFYLVKVSNGEKSLVTKLIKK